MYFLQRRRDAHESWGGVCTKAEARFVAAHDHQLETEPRANHTQLREDQQSIGFLRQRPKPIAQLLSERLNLTELLDTREAAIKVELRVVVRDVIICQVRRRIEGDVRRRKRDVGRFTLQRPNGLVQPPHV